MKQRAGFTGAHLFTWVERLWDNDAANSPKTPALLIFLAESAARQTRQLRHQRVLNKQVFLLKSFTLLKQSKRPAGETTDLPWRGASSHLLTVLCILISLIHDLLVHLKNGTAN